MQRNYGFTKGFWDATISSHCVSARLGKVCARRTDQFFGFVSSVAEGTKARSLGCFPRVASISS